MLDLEIFKIVVENTPLFAIDLVVINSKQQILLGKRVNAPAKDYWFVPRGGRVYKNETLEPLAQLLKARSILSRTGLKKIKTYS